MKYIIPPSRNGGSSAHLHVFWCYRIKERKLAQPASVSQIDRRACAFAFRFISLLYQLLPLDVPHADSTEITHSVDLNLTVSTCRSVGQQHPATHAVIGNPKLLICVGLLGFWLKPRALLAAVALALGSCLYIAWLPPILAVQKCSVSALGSLFHFKTQSNVHALNSCHVASQ